MRGERHRTRSVGLERVVALLLGAALLAGLIAAPSGASSGSGSSPTASAAKKKKCKKRKLSKKANAKRRKCKKKKSQPTAPAPAKLSIDPASVDFGAVQTGQTTHPTQQFVITNTGGSPSSGINAGVTGPNADQFPPQNDNCTGNSLDPGQSCGIQARFIPTSTGAKSARLSATAGGATGGAALSGNAVAPASFSITPPSHDFMTVTAGTMSAAFTFTVMNGPTTPIVGLSAQLSGANFNQFTISNNACPPLLGPSTSCAIDVKFSPTSSGAKSANLDVSDPLGGTVSAPLTGTGTGLTITPNPFNFGTTASGSPVTQTFTVTNNAPVISGNLGPRVYGGANPNDYTNGLLNTCSGLPLAASGGTCTFAVRFNPVAGGGVRTSSGTVSIGASPGGTAVAALSGTKSP